MYNSTLLCVLQKLRNNDQISIFKDLFFFTLKSNK